MITQKPTGAGARLPWIVQHDAPKRIDQDLLDRLLAIEDLSSTVSDVLDEMGVIGAVGASTLPPSIAGGRVVGTAITVRNQERSTSVATNAAHRDWKMAELLAIAEAAPGDVLVIEGLRAVSNMGGIMATVAKRQGLAGAVVDGAVRDAGRSRALKFPVWSRDVSPVTGKWRCVTREINGPVRVAGLGVAAGDLVVADETGICFVPAAIAAAVTARCEEIASYEAALERRLEQGLPLEDLVKELYGSRSPASADDHPVEPDQRAGR